MSILKIASLALSLTFVGVGTDNWFHDKDQAMAYAQEHDGEVLMVFAGSDWCRPCIQFKQSILISPEFEEYSKDNLAILYLDFPAKRKNKLSAAQTEHNEALAEKYNLNGSFPKILLFDKELQDYREIAFKGQSPDEFIQEIKSTVR